MTIDLCKAIEERRMIAFTYDGLPRVVCPAAYGQHVDTGKVTLRAFQTGGQSSSGKLPAWRLFTVDKMQGPEIQEDSFALPLPDYTSNDKHLDVVCEL